MSIHRKARTYAIRDLSVEDIPLIADYWSMTNVNDYQRMGVDPKKMFTKEEFTDKMKAQLALPIENRTSFCTIWLVDERPIGHSNTNPTIYGQEAMFHLHIWKEEDRRSGYGEHLLPKSIRRFFDILHLKKIIAEPFHQNPGPNRLLEKLGFTLDKVYRTTPGQVNLEQIVNRWVLLAEQLDEVNW